MNWKLIVYGTLAFYLASFIAGMAVTGPLIHEGILDEAYKATTAHWRPELTAEPPQLGALMPRWIINGLIGTVVVVIIYDWIRPAFSGAGWKQGLTYGFILTLISAVYYLGLSGVFSLPDTIWLWWTVDSLILNSIGGLALGFVAQKVAPNN